MLGIIVATTLIALFLNLILKSTFTNYYWIYFNRYKIAYIFNLHSIVDNHELKEIAEFGVVFLMFTIGLEFSINHLKKMKRGSFSHRNFTNSYHNNYYILIAKFVAGFSTQTALIMGTALSLSSTAIVLKTFNETKEITKPHGRRVLGILIMQDIAVIPILLMISFFFL